jgi:hypothetical protein
MPATAQSLRVKLARTSRLWCRRRRIAVPWLQRRGLRELLLWERRSSSSCMMVGVEGSAGSGLNEGAIVVGLRRRVEA